ncbi:unnamed protein product [Rhizophagus irregularis]|nr:unnamed protein product [Rhizophagus irregularis]
MTITDAYPLPRIDDLLEKFRVAKWFTTIDLASGYWQIEIKEEDKEKTNEHLQHIEIVLEELRKANMMLKLKKCEWAKKNVEYLGHIVGTDGLKPDDKKIEKIKNRVPNGSGQVR